MTHSTKPKSTKAESASANSSLRELPAVDEIVLEMEMELEGDGVGAEIPAPLLRDFARIAIDDARASLRSSSDNSKANPGALRNKIVRAIRKSALKFSRRGPKRVINCTGVIAHTNLGRAPLSRESLSAVAETLSGWRVRISW